MKKAAIKMADTTESPSVMTVLGPVSIDQLGIILPHEHLFLDLRNQFKPFNDPETDRLSREPVGMQNLGRLRRNPLAMRDNLVLDDLELAAQELEFFKCLGGRTIVDCTVVGIKRDPRKLRTLAEKTGLHIIAGCGYYTQDTHPSELGRWSVEEIAEQMISDLTEGMDGADIRAGVIGEIGTSHPIHPDEWKVLKAAALAYRQTAVPIQVHINPFCARGLEIADFLIREGVPPAKIVICHADVQASLDYMEQVLARGVYLEFDNFGKEFWIDPSERGVGGGVFMYDGERVLRLKRLRDNGFLNRLLITNDLCLKSMLRAYGGWGYDHILLNVVPMLLEAGFVRDEIDQLVRRNPAALFG